MEYEHHGLLHDLFRKQAELTPDRPAVVLENQTLTFHQLNELTDLLANNLQLKGVKPDSIVGIYMKKCVEYVIAYISILKAGGAYMPLDVSYPISLLDDILQDAEPVVIIAQSDLTQYLKNAKQVSVLDDDWEKSVKQENDSSKKTFQPPVLTLDNLAYTVYSSGTTGKPKGIQCPHRGAVFSYTWRHMTYPYADDGKEREACNIFFVWEMLRPLLRGVTMYIVPDEVIYDPQLLVSFLQNNEITRMLYTPSLFEAMLDSLGDEVIKYFKVMRLIIFCGEVVTAGLFERCITLLPDVQFINLYSISECHDAACSDLTQWYKQEQGITGKKKFCPIGQVLPGVHVIILNDQLELQPVGKSGEIYVGGPTLARGYLNRPELNIERFITTPASLQKKYGERLYRTGDWGYTLSDGSFEICGRCDSMVKIRGYSIETQAVERALMEIPLVNSCVVMVTGEEGQDKHLVAYVVPNNSATKKKIRAALKKRLPFYMIPSYFVCLTSIPLLPSSGKLDKKALPPLGEANTVVDAEGMATTVTEKRLLPLWAEVLQIQVLDIQDSFFDLGGHSLLATKLLRKVHDEFGIEITVRDLFHHSSIFALGKLLQDKRSPDPRMSVDISAPLDLKKEVEKYNIPFSDLDMQLRAFWRSLKYTFKRKKGCVLLTGATGFLGTFLLRDLMLSSELHVFCLVRGQPDMKPSERIEMTLRQHKMLATNQKQETDAQANLQQQLDTRMTAIKGDVGIVNMGMKEEDYNYLCTEIDIILHAAAYVNLIYPYQALRGPNVIGTQNVLKFACTSKIKPVHYISTDAVFPHGLRDCPEDADMTSYCDRLDDGYSQTKWVAEQLVLRAMKHGLPATVYRLGNMSGDSETGAWNPQDLTLLFIKGCILTGCAPHVEWHMEMTPVNFVTSSIVNILTDRQMTLGHIYHFINSRPIKSQWLFEWMSVNGYSLQMVPYEQWTERINNSGSVKESNQLLIQLLDIMIKDGEYFKQLSTYKQPNLDVILQQLNLTYPIIDQSLLTKYFMQLTRNGVIPKPKKLTTGKKPLEGQVAVVTGASSGIGAAVAKSLAEAGAKVAMAARRIDKLSVLKEDIERTGATAIAVECDVTNREDVAELLRHTECTLGNVDILVNNAGIMLYTMMKNLCEEDWHRQVDINCKGVLNCIGAVLGGMVSRKKGHIVNMSSDAGRRGFAGLAVYSGTKFFVEGLSQGLRHEVAKSGVKVTCIQPGDVRTELLTHTTDQEAREAYDGSGSTQILEPDDIADAILYAVTRPPYAAINELLIEPREAPI